MPIFALLRFWQLPSIYNSLKLNELVGVDFVVVMWVDRWNLLWGSYPWRAKSAWYQRLQLWGSRADYSGTFEIARSRRKLKLTSIDKQNVLATSKLWRIVVEKLAGFQMWPWNTSWWTSCYAYDTNPSLILSWRRIFSRYSIWMNRWFYLARWSHIS